MKNKSVSIALVVIIVVLVSVASAVIYFATTKKTAPLSISTPKIVQKSATEKTNPSDVYAKVLDAMSEYKKIQLKSFGANTSASEPPYFISYLFIADGKVVSMQYDMSSKEVKKAYELNLKEAKLQEDNLPSLKWPDVPSEIAAAGLESAFSILENNNEYAKYKETNPEEFTKYLARLNYDGTTGWSWDIFFANTMFADVAKKEGRKTIRFNIDIAKKEVVVSDKINIIE